MFDLVARLKLQDDFSSKMRRATQHMADAERKTRSLTSGMRNFGSQVAAIGTAIGVTAVVSKGFSMMRNSMDTAFKRIDTMEQFERVMNVMIGDTAKVAETLERTREAVTGTAYTLNGAAASVQNFVTRGVEVDKATGYIEAWGDAVAFYGDGSQDQFDNVNDALGKMLGKGKVTMDQLDRIMHAGIPAVDLYADKMGMSTAAVQEALSKGQIDAKKFVDTVSEAMVKGGNKFGSIAGAAKEAGASWGSVFGNMRTHIATGVEEIIKSIDKVLAENGLPDLRAMVKRFGETFRDTLKGVASRIPEIVERIKTVNKALEPWYPMIKQIGKGALIAAGVVAGIAGIVGVFGAVGTALSFIISPIGLVAAGAMLLSVAFQKAYENSEEFRNKVDGVIKAVKGLFSGKSGVGDLLEALGFSPKQILALRGFIGKAKDIFFTVKDKVIDVFTSLYSISQPILSALGNAFSILAGVAVVVFNNVIAPAVKLIWETFQTLWKIVAPVLELMGAAIGVTFEVLKVVWDTILKPVTKFILGAFKDALESISPALDKVGGVFDWLGGKIKGVAGWLKDVANWFKNIEVPDWVSKVGGTVGGFFVKGSQATSSNYHGLDSVPYDGYISRLHKGEKILPASEAKEYRQGNGGMRDVNINIQSMNVRKESDIEQIANSLAIKIFQAQEAGA